jgi:hypothetical protein
MVSSPCHVPHGQASADWACQLHKHHTPFGQVAESSLIVVLLQGGAEKLSDEAIEGTLEKVIKLLAYISDKVRSRSTMCTPALTAMLHLHRQVTHLQPVHI